MTFADYKQAVEMLPYGKRLPTARYVFTDAESPLPEPLAELVQKVRQRFAADGPHNLIKFHTESLKISLLHYPGFFDEPHPALSTLDTFFAGPDSKALRLKMNELILNGRR